MLDKSLRKSFETLARLDHVSRRAVVGTHWRRDLERSMQSYRNLLAGFSRTLETL